MATPAVGDIVYQPQHGPDEGYHFRVVEVDEERNLIVAQPVDRKTHRKVSTDRGELDAVEMVADRVKKVAD